MFLPVCELSHFISFLPLLPHPTNVRLDAIFLNLEKLWRGAQNPFGGTVPRCPPLTTGLSENVKSHSLITLRVLSMHTASRV